MKFKFNCSFGKVAKLIVVAVFFLTLFAVKYSPWFLFNFVFSKKIEDYGKYIYDQSQDFEYNKNLDEYMIDPENKMGLKNILILGCDMVEGASDCYGADIVLLVSRRKNGEIHIYNLLRDNYIMTFCDGRVAKLTDICRSYSKKDFIESIERTYGIRIDDFFAFNLRGIKLEGEDNNQELELIPKIIDTYCSKGLTLNISEIEKIGINQILASTVEPEKWDEYLFKDNEGNYFGKKEIDYISNYANFIYYTRKDDTVKILADSNGNPSAKDEKGITVSESSDQLDMYVQYIPEGDDDKDVGIEFNGKRYIKCIQKDNFKTEAYAWKLYQINKICGTLFSDEKQPVVLNSKQIQAFCRLRFAYQQQGLKRDDNVVYVIKVLFKYLFENKELIFSEKTEQLLDYCGKHKMIVSSCDNLSLLAGEMYPKIALVQYGDYVNVGNDVLHIKIIPDPYYPVNEYLLRKQMEWIVYGDDQGDQK